MSHEPELIQGGAFAFLRFHCGFIIIIKCYEVNHTPLMGYFQLKAENIVEFSARDLRYFLKSSCFFSLLFCFSGTLPPSSLCRSWESFSYLFSHF